MFAAYKDCPEDHTLEFLQSQSGEQRATTASI